MEEVSTEETEEARADLEERRTNRGSCPIASDYFRVGSDTFSKPGQRGLSTHSNAAGDCADPEIP